MKTQFIFLLTILYFYTNTLFAQVEFGPQQIISNEADGAIDVFAADFNGDGKMDALSASSNNNELAWYENDGTGNFIATHLITSTLDTPTAVYAADLNGDGNIDILSASSGDNTIAWYPNDGNGNFTNQINISTQAIEAQDVFAADLDKDGNIDVISASSGDNKIAWYRNEDGLGSFSTPNIISLDADGAKAVFAIDINIDDNIDVLSASSEDNKIAWYENNEDGSFTTHIISTDVDGARSVFATYLNDDEHIDILSASLDGDNILWFENNGLQSFNMQPPLPYFIDTPYDIYAVDLDADNDADILATSFNEDKVIWYENDGTGNFIGQNIISTETNGASAVFPVDLDGDLDMDILSASTFDDKIAWYENLLGLTVQVFENSKPCVGLDNGSLQISLTGGLNDLLPPYTYTWTFNDGEDTGTGVSTTETFIIGGLIEGSYDITVTNSFGEIATFEDFLLDASEGSFFEIIDITTTNTGGGNANGSIEVTISGGNPDYTFSWTGTAIGNHTTNNTSHLITDSSAGTYLITVADSEGNSATHTVSILDETNPVSNCESPLDIVILNDVSGSVDGQEYQESKQFFVDLVQALNIGTGTNDSRAAIVEWSGSGGQSLRIPITGLTNQLEGYSSMSRAFSGGTNPQAALRYGYDYLETEAHLGATKVLVLSTDGSSSQVSGSLIALSKQYQAEGYVIVTIAFDSAYSNAYTLNILSETASIPLLAPGAASYSALSDELASNIVNLYVCPAGLGSSNTVYFNRDGALDIIDYNPIDFCPTPQNIEVIFTVTAQQQLSLPPGTPITFYYNNPSLFSATTILTTFIPCAIEAGASETLTVILPVGNPASIWGVLNDDGSQSPPINFPITNISENIYANNTDQIAVCTDPIPTLSATKYTLTPKPICNNTVSYTIDLCNISNLDAVGVALADESANGFVLENRNFNLNNCATSNNDGSFDIPAACCVSITYQYNADAATAGLYNNQGLTLSGPEGQIYQDFNAAITSAEDVTIGEGVNCDSDVVLFNKSVNTTEICEESFLTYTFTINNQTNVALQGIQFQDVIPTPTIWAAEPYLLSGLSIGATDITGSQTAEFTIAEIAPKTTAHFSMDIYLDDWNGEGFLDNTATLSGLPNFVNGNGANLNSSSETVTVFVAPTIEMEDSITIFTNETASLTPSSVETVLWTSLGDGNFTNPNNLNTVYAPGTLDISEGFAHLILEVENDCGEARDTIVISIVSQPCNTPNAPTTLEENLFICEGEPNTQPFQIEFPSEVSLIWFESDNSNDSNPITFGENAIFEDAGTYYAATYTVSEMDTCFSPRVAFTIEEIILTAENSGDVTIAEGESTEITSTVTSSIPNATFTVEWNGGEGLSDYFIENPTANPTQTTTYTTTFTDNNNCMVSSSLTVFVLSPEPCTTPDAPTAIEETLFICEDKSNTEPFNLQFPSNAFIAWFESNNSNDSIPIALGDDLVFEEIGAYYAATYTISAIDTCYSERVSLSIAVEDCSPNQENVLPFIPSAFSPNNDGINDYCQPIQPPFIESVSFSIYSRFGERIYYSEDNSAKWDGFHKWQEQEIGVYVYVFEYRHPDLEGIQLLQGNVTLIR